MNAAKAGIEVLVRVMLVLFWGGLPTVWAETSEEANPPGPAATPSGDPSKVMESLNTGAWVNEFTGQAAFAVPLGAVSNHGGISFSLALNYYGGGLEHRSQAKPEFNPISWVGEGFSMAAPHIMADKKGTASPGDDEYFLSLDGQAQVTLIPETGNPDFLYPKNNPFIKVQRVRSSITGAATDPWLISPNTPANTYPTANSTFTLDQVKEFLVTMPNGSLYSFGSGGTICNESNVYSFCVPTTGEKMGYEPFYNFDGSARVPVQWYLREIRSPDNKFSIFLNYEKISEPVTGIVYAGTGIPASPSLYVDRAIYLLSVYSVNGNVTTAPKIESIVFTSENRNPIDYFDNTALDILGRVEKKRLMSLSFYKRSNPAPDRIMTFGYSPPAAYSRTRLLSVRDSSEGIGRNLYNFNYDDAGSKGWRITKVKAPNSMDWNYAYGSLSTGITNFFSHSMDLSGYLVSAYDKPTIFMQQEVGNRLFLGVDEQACPIQVNTKRRVFEIENNGNYWILRRVFISRYWSPCNNKTPVVIAPDGSYMAWAEPSANNSRAYVRIFKLKPATKSTVDTIDLGSPATIPPGMEVSPPTANSYGIITGDPANSDGVALIPFNNWLVGYNFKFARSVAFYYKNASGAWQDYQIGGSCSVPHRNLSLQQINENAIHCFALSDATVGAYHYEVRSGDNFVVVRYNEYQTAGGPNGSVVRAYSFQNGAFKEFTFGLRKSAFQKNVTRFIPPTNPSQFVPENDLDFVFDNGLSGGTGEYEILDVAVYRDLVGVVVGNGPPPVTSQSGPRYLYLFSWDGKQLRFLHQHSIGISSGSEPAMYLHENYFLYKNGTTNRFDVFTINRKDWKVNLLPTGIPFLAGSTPARNTAKLYPGYFHIEDNNQRSAAFKPAAVEKLENNYQGNLGTLYSISITPTGGSFAQVNGVTPAGNNIENFFLRGDRYLGVIKNYDPVYTDGNPGFYYYVYGRMTTAGIQKQWLPTTANGGLLAYLTSSGVMEVEYGGGVGGNKWSGLLYFLGDQAGGLDSRTNTASVVQRVTVNSRGTASTTEDGTQRLFDLSYVVGTGGAMNYSSKIPAITSVTITDAVNSHKMITDFHIDQAVMYPIAMDDRVLHGQIRSRKYIPGVNPQVNRQPGEVWKNFYYKVRSYPNSPGGGALEEAVKVGDATKVTDKLHFFDHSLTTETRLAMPYPHNGAPQVSVVKKGGDYTVSVTRFLHEFDNSTLFKTIPKQTAGYLFKTDPCSGGSDPNNPDPCANIANQDFTWLLTAANSKRAVSSQIIGYNASGSAQSLHRWKPKQLGTSGLMVLNGVVPGSSDYTTQGKWILASTVLSRAVSQTLILNKHEGPTEVDAQGVHTTTFYGAREGLAMAKVTHAKKFICTYLGAEEETVGTNFGSFGDWAGGTGRVVSSEAARTGKNSVKVTTFEGPTAKQYYRPTGQNPDYWDRKKGILVSGWIYVRGNASQNPLPAAKIEFKYDPNATTARAAIDLVTEYQAANGNLPYNRWVKLERLVTWDELNSFTYQSNAALHYLRVWFGKASSANTFPVYVDDLRIHPADAVMQSMAYDIDKGRIMATSDANNEPSFMVYDSWGAKLGVKDDKGRLFSASAFKRLED